MGAFKNCPNFPKCQKLHCIPAQNLPKFIKKFSKFLQKFPKILQNLATKSGHLSTFSKNVFKILLHLQKNDR